MNWKTCTLLLLWPVWMHAAAPAPQGALFRNVSIREAQRLAASENKPVLVHFSAAWCMPCQWMEANTFSDPALSRYLEERFIAVKVDIDELEGNREKERFEVRLLPTLIILNALGEVIGRHQESMAPDRLMQLMQRYAPGPAMATPGMSAPKSQTAHLNRPAMTTEAPASRPAANTPPAGVTTGSAFSPASFPTGDNIPAKRYGVQVGAFSSMTNANRIKYELENRYRLPVQIVQDPAPNQTLPFFKVVIGAFGSADDAAQLLQRLQQEGKQGYVREI